MLQLKIHLVIDYITTQLITNVVILKCDKIYSMLKLCCDIAISHIYETRHDKKMKQRKTSELHLWYI